MIEGTVVRFNKIKGYGFINIKDSKDEIFVHYSNIIGDGYKELEAGQTVKFETEQGPKGLFAKNISILSN
ncbi:MAG: cspA [Francisellaceae bacterium]|nr:cspA [Francisellaceae bacterium]